MTDETQGVVVRLRPEEHGALLGYCHATDTSVNQVMQRALQEFLLREARQEHVRGAAEKFQRQYAVALEKLADL